ncbi:MAG: hypothetical protein ACI4UF_01035, partial [Thermoguttaceae bacterium]
MPLGLARNFRFGIITNTLKLVEDLLGLARNFRFGIIRAREEAPRKAAGACKEFSFWYNIFSPVAEVPCRWG